MFLNEEELSGYLICISNYIHFSWKSLSKQFLSFKSSNELVVLAVSASCPVCMKAKEPPLKKSMKYRKNMCWKTFLFIAWNVNYYSRFISNPVSIQFLFRIFFCFFFFFFLVCLSYSYKWAKSKVKCYNSYVVYLKAFIFAFLFCII